MAYDLPCCGEGLGSPSSVPSKLNTMIGCCILALLVPFWSRIFPQRRSPITESTREVLFLFDWCFCAWLPPSLYLRDPRASLGDCEDRSHSRPLQRKWSGVSPRPPSGGSPLAGTTLLHCSMLQSWMEASIASASGSSLQLKNLSSCLGCQLGCDNSTSSGPPCPGSDERSLDSASNPIDRANISGLSPSPKPAPWTLPGLVYCLCTRLVAQASGS